MGQNRLGDGQLGGGNSIQDRRGALQDRLGGGRGDQLGGRDREQIRQDRQDTRGDRQQTRLDRRDTRDQTRTDRQENRGDRRDEMQQNRGDRQENREQRRDDIQQNRENRFDNREQRRDEWQQCRDNWWDNRNQICEDWQDYRDQCQGDWQNWFGDNYGYYGDWYSGYAPGYWDQSDYLWDDYPVAAAAGLTWWGANALGYGFGYSDYTNPYYVESMPAYYTEPIVTEPVVNVSVAPVHESTVVTPPADSSGAATAPAASPPAAGSSEVVSKFDLARAAFREGRYDEALRLTDAAIALKPRDAVLHEFRSLVLFALQRFHESAATIHPVLDVGPGWDWKTLCSLYPTVDVYTQQLRALEAARNKDLKAADVHFLLGYHYLTCGYADKALTEFRAASEAMPNDTVSASLLATLSPREAKPAAAPPAAAPNAVAAESVLGTWKATGKGTSTYAMSLRGDGSFTWGFATGSRKQEVKGVHALEGNVLAMEPDSGGVMLAEVSLKDPDTLHFKMIGGASGDPGLDFRREATK